MVSADFIDRTEEKPWNPGGIILFGKSKGIKFVTGLNRKEAFR